MKKNWQSNEPCMICGTITQQRTFHHLISRKSNPALMNEPYNLFSVCLRDHQRIHQLGLEYFASKIPDVKIWLLNHGWEFCEIRKKWFKPLE